MSTNTRSLIEFLETNGIRWMPINLEVKEGRTKFKKTLMPYKEDGEMPSYNDLANIHLVVKRQEYIDNYQYICFHQFQR